MIRSGSIWRFTGTTQVFSLISLWLCFHVLLSSCTREEKGGAPFLFWCSNNPREISFCSQLTADWNGLHKNDQIVIQPVPAGQSSEEVILAAVVGKTTPDIYANMWQGNVEMYARAGVLIPLDTLEGFSEFIRERCDSAVISEITSPDGHIYQVPWKVNPIMTIYNKNIFLENGIKDLPKTYSSYLKAAELFKTNNENRNLLHMWFGYTEVKEIWYERLFNFYTLYLAASDGAQLIENNKAAFNNKHAVEVFSFLQSLYINGYFSREQLSTGSDPFVGQQIATNWTGPWQISHLTNIPGRNFDYDFFEPIAPDEHTGPVYTYADPKNIVIFNTCKRPQEAWNFVKTLVDREGDLRLLEETGQLPRRRNLLTDPFFSDYFLSNTMMVTFAKQVPYVKGVDNCEVIVEVFDIISQEYIACVVYQRKTPEQAVADAADEVNVLLGKSLSDSRK